MRRVLVTGGAGFIGSNLVRLFLREQPDWQITALDALTYCGNLDNFSQDIWDDPRFTFWHGDIRDEKVVENLMRPADAVIHLAAETHVDRSLNSATGFVSTDVVGTQVLLEAARRFPVERFLHISTSEVYGTALQIPMTEDHPLNPQSPYGAAKAGGDRLAYAYHVAYGLPVVILRPFNAYGPHQYPEKLIPLFVTNALDEEPLPVYGDGTFTRDWTHVEDTCRALEQAMEADISEVGGEVMNLGTGVDTDVNALAAWIVERLGKSQSLIKFVPDRPGHLRRLVCSTSKARILLGWSPTVNIESGLARTVDWYVNNRQWWEKLKAGSRTREGDSR